MCSENQQSFGKKPRRKHITDNKPISDNLTYIDDVVREIETTLSSPESALLLSSLYDINFNFIDENEDVAQLGPVLYREEEDIISCGRTDILIKTYYNFNINKFFGITLIEFMDLEGWQINLLTENATDIMLKQQEELKELEEEVGGTNTKKEINNIESSYEDLLDKGL